MKSSTNAPQQGNKGGINLQQDGQEALHVLNKLDKRLSIYKITLGSVSVLIVIAGFWLFQIQKNINEQQQYTEQIQAVLASFKQTNQAFRTRNHELKDRLNKQYAKLDLLKARYAANVYYEQINTTTYRVKSKDNLWEIAKHYYSNGKHMCTIAKANDLENPGLIAVNKNLKIPK